MHGLYRYLAKNARGKKGQSGFTLIELLVVVTILGVLAAIVTLSLVGLTTNAQAKACEQEYKTVQAGLDAYMANNNLDTVPATGTSGTNDMTTPVLLYNSAPTADKPTYVRNSPTQWAYEWDATGRIKAIHQFIAGGGGTNGPSVPTGCTVSGG
jgi:prepilin-type N-terminal cleavage/methylation domain-containing protein